jgi:hypothetical protein
MEFFKMAAFTYGVETQDYNGGVMGEVRDLVREKEELALASFKMPDRPKRPNLPKQATKEERKRAEVEYKKADASYQAKYREVQKQRETARQKIRQDQRMYQEPMNDIRDTMRYTSVSTRDRKLTLPHDYAYSDAKPKSAVSPGTMMGHTCDAQPGETPLQAYARWMTGKDNPRFTTVIANRLWKKAFGLALIEPLDELMDMSVPMIPALQKHLDQLMKDVNYDTKAFLRILFNTSAYQREVTKKEHAPGDTYHFTGPLLRRMTAEQMWDSLVTLINPNPDMINFANREAMQQRVLQAKKNADGVDALSPEEALRGIELSAAVYRKNRERTEGAQKRYADARTVAKTALEEAESMKVGPDRDKALAKAKELREAADKIRSEVNAIQNEGRRVAYNEIILPGQKKLYQEVTGKPAASIAVASGEGAPAMMAGDMMMAAAGGKAERVLIPGYDRKVPTPEEKKAEGEATIAAYNEEAQFYGLPEKQWKEYRASRGQQVRTWLRSAEIESPAPRGHPIRIFGQSDRETIENANSDASVPQSLAMMNGDFLPQVLHKYSQLMLGINKAQYPDDKVEAAYMAILTRKPTAAEKDTWLKAQDAGLSSMEYLIFALLNTQQFIFVQ